MTRAAGTRPVGVIGAGTLGTTVAQLLLDCGDEAVIVVRDGPGKVERAEQSIRTGLSREVKAGRLDPAGAENALRRARVTTDVGALGACELVVECLPEVLTEKRAMLRRVEPHLAADAIFASATSSLPAHEIGEGARRPGRVAIAHYVWPANRTRLVEVAFPEGADDDVAPRLLDRLQSQRKQPLVVRDVAGFLITRVVMAYWSETVDAVAEGVSPAAIDARLEARGWPIGPCRLLDGASLHSAVTVARAVASVMGDRLDGVARLAPLVAAGFAGGAGGDGLYRHGPGGAVENEPALALLRAGRPECAPPDDVADRIMQALVREAELCVADGVVSSLADAALGIDLAYGFPGGLLAYARPGSGSTHER